MLGKCSSLWNVYGPTETTVWFSVYAVNGISERISIGKPIPNLSAYVLDEEGRLAPVGVAGELCIGGVGLSRGYWRRPELAAERFVPHPFSDRPGERLYRTGDSARWREGGNLEFLGRTDDQVKVRGHRIELGEIQSVLEEHPKIERAVAVVWDDPSGVKELVAYVVVKKDESLQVRQMQAFLEEKLPSYMVPAFYVKMDAFPQTPSGKVDRKRLPPPDRMTASSRKTYLKPRDTIEANLQQIWEEVLGVR